MASSVEAGGFFRAEGYAILRGVLDASSVSHWNQTIERILDVHRGALGLDPSADIKREVLCLHQPHKLEPELESLARDPVVVDVLRDVIGPDIKCMQSQAFLKPPAAPGNAWHQDEAAIPTRDRSLVAAWFALDDATTVNGCVRIVPRSHASGQLFPVGPHGRGDDFDFPTECTGWNSSDEPIDAEVEAGDVVLFHGYAVHGSEPNRSTAMRRALTFHYMTASSLLPWKVPVRVDQTEVTTALADYRDVFMAAGIDPYAWKGYEDRSFAHLRRWGRPGQAAPGARRVDPRLSPDVRQMVTEALRRWNGDEVEAIDLIRRALASIDVNPPGTPDGRSAPA